MKYYHLDLNSTFFICADGVLRFWGATPAQGQGCLVRKWPLISSSLLYSVVLRIRSTLSHKWQALSLEIPANSSFWVRWGVQNMCKPHDWWWNGMEKTEFSSAGKWRL